MEEEKLMKKTELKHLFRGQKKKKPSKKQNKQKNLRESGVTNSQFQFRKNEKCYREVRYEMTERCPLNLTTRIIGPSLTNSIS